MKTWTIQSVRAAALLTLLAGPGACDPGEPEDTGAADDGADGNGTDADDDDDRGPLGKADQAGSCEDHCGGQSDEVCWCDDLCAEFGDCCSDYEAVCTEPASCDEPNPAGCTSDDECGDGESCVTDTEACIPSACSCEGGSWLCTADCSGGVCEPDAEPTCEDPNPAGCGSDDECGDGEVCVVDPNECISSACDCEGGVWQCTPDCNGGVCEPESADACAGPNPADTCQSESDCIPSGCDCADGVWQCTPDCSGGLDC